MIKKLKLSAILCVLLLGTVKGNAQKSDATMIREVITAFSKAGDQNNAKELDNCLDDNFRVVMNRLFDSNDVNILSKAVYIEKISSKEFGGDQRTLVIDNILINGSTASAKVTFKGSRMTFVSLILLIKDHRGSWKLISDIPVVQ